MKAGRIIHIILAMLVVLLFANRMILDCSKVKENFAKDVTSILEANIGTRIETGSITLQRPCGISIRNLVLYDKSGDTLLACRNASARMKIIPLLRGKLLISNIKLMKPDIRLSRTEPDAEPNWQFLLDMGSDSGDSSKMPDVRVNSILIGGGHISYDILSEPVTDSLFNLSHIDIDKLNANISLKSLSPDSVNLLFRKLNMTEHSGLTLSHLKGRLVAGRDNAFIEKFRIEMPGTLLNIPYLVLETGLALDTPFTVPAFDATLQQSYITPSDLSALIPSLRNFNDPIMLDISTHGSIQDYLSIDSVHLSVPAAGAEISGFGTLHGITEPSAATVSGAHLNALIEDRTFKHLQNHLDNTGIELPSILQQLGKASLKCFVDGGIDNFTASADAITEAGNIILKVKGRNGSYSFEADGKGIEAGLLSGIGSLGRADLTASTSFTLKNDTTLENGTFHIRADEMVFNGHTYKGIVADALFDSEKVSVEATADPMYGELLIKANATLDPVIPAYNIDLKAERLDLAALDLVNKDSISLLTAQIKADMTGIKPDDIRGELTVYGLEYTNQEGVFTNNRIEVLSKDIDGHQTITVNSDIAEMILTGRFNITSVPASVLAVLEEPLPSLYSWITEKTGLDGKRSGSDEFIADLKLQKTDLFRQVLHIPLEFEGVTAAHMFINDHLGLADININLPALELRDNHIERGSLVLSSARGLMNLRAGATYSKEQEESTRFSCVLAATDNTLGSELFWNKEEPGAFEGSLVGSIDFGAFDSNSGFMRTTVNIDTTTLTINNVDWALSDATITSDSSYIDIDNLRLEHEDQFVQIQGRASSDSTDVLTAMLQDIDIRVVTQMLRKSSLGLAGMASGNVSASGVMGTPAFSGDLSAHEFEFLGCWGGDLDVSADWNEDTENIELDILLEDGLASRTVGKGIFSPRNDSIDININADHTDLAFLNRFLKKIFNNVRGYAVGDLRLFGHMPGFDLEGEAILEEGYLTQSFLNNTFIVKRDTLRFKKGEFDFHNVEFYDEYGHDGILSCTIKHNHLKNFDVDFTADVANMQILSVPETSNGSIYGKALVEGSVNLHSYPDKRITIQSDCRTAPGTSIVANVGSNNVSNYSFLTFVDRNIIQPITGLDSLPPPPPDGRKDVKRGNKAKLTVDINLECSDDAAIMMKMSSFNASIRGNGNVSVDYNDLDGVRLNGIYNVNYGLGTLSMQGLIRKEFSMLEDSYIRFTGAPAETQLNLHTGHVVNSASMYDLQSDISGGGNVKVRCLLDILGTVNNPQLSFDVDMPQGTAEYQDILASATSTEEQRNLQFMYLLGLGKFYTYDYSNQAAINGMSSSTMESLLNSTLNGQINNLLSQVFDSDVFSLSSNVSAGSYLTNDQTSLSNRELEGILEARLLNNRLLVNGNFGYRENVLTNSANFIGDFELQYVLFPKYGISLKGYNHNNDRYFTKTTLTTQGIGLMFEKDFDRLWKIR